MGANTGVNTLSQILGNENFALTLNLEKIQKTALLRSNISGLQRRKTDVCAAFMFAVWSVLTGDGLEQIREIV